MKEEFKFLPEIRAAIPRVVGVPDILGMVDAAQKLILTLEELNTHLARLLATGEIQEHPGRMFGPGDGMPKTFRPLSAAEFDTALATYERTFAEKLEALTRRDKERKGD